ncbi:MAG: selenocysteine-specific translation elongation factor [bacterium]
MEDTSFSKRVIIGTSGHVDHGKSKLVQALTGTDPDRLKVEKEREMTTDLGFAFLKLTSNQTIPIIDVPGHERFVKTMVAGAAGIDLVLFIVASNEGIAQQTREHLDILKLLHIQKGILVLTKIDLVTDEQIASIEHNIKDFVNGSFLEKAPIVKVSAVTQQGIPALIKEIGKLAEVIQSKETAGIFRQPIDRAFIIQGFGTVITGTVLSGIIRVGDEIEILPQQKQVRVRGLQVCEKSVEHACAGQRAAVNLSGIEKSEIERGNVLCTPGFFSITRRIDAQLTVLPSAKKTLTTNTAVFLHHGASEIAARLVLLKEQRLKESDSTPVQFILEKPLIAAYGDRFIMRSYSPAHTIGGGKILKVHARRHTKKFYADDIAELEFLETAPILKRVHRYISKNHLKIELVSAIAKHLSIAPLELSALLADLAGQQLIVLIGEKDKTVCIDMREYQKLQQHLLDVLASFHKQSPFLAGITPDKLKSMLHKTLHIDDFRYVLKDLEKQNKIKLREGAYSLFAAKTALTQEQSRLRQEIEHEIKKNPFLPPNPDQLLEKLKGKKEDVYTIYHLLLKEGILLKIAGKAVFHKDAVKQAEKMLVDYIKLHKQMTAAVFRDILKSNRKYAVTLLEYFDKINVTRRSGDAHLLKRE